MAEASSDSGDVDKTEALIPIIGLARLFKASLCVALVVGILALRGFGLAATSRVATVVERMAHFAHLDSLDLSAAALVATAYTFVYAAEAYGLLLRRRWGERLTLIATAGFIPVELYAIARHPGTATVGVLLANVAIVAFLAWRRWGQAS